MQIQFCEEKGQKLAIFEDALGNQGSFQSDQIQGVPVLRLGLTSDFQGNRCQRLVLDKHRALIIREIINQFIEKDFVCTSPETLPDSIKPRNNENPN